MLACLCVTVANIPAMPCQTLQHQLVARLIPFKTLTQALNRTDSPLLSENNPCITSAQLEYCYHVEAALSASVLWLSFMSWSSIPAPQGNGHFQWCLSNESNRAPALAMAQIPAAHMNTNVHKHNIAGLAGYNLLNCNTSPFQ